MRKFGLTVLFLVLSFIVFGQEKIPFKEKLTYGGSMSATFGNITNVSLSPEIGYKLKDNWTIGIGGLYNYYKDKRYSPVFDMSTYGGSIFTRLIISDQFIAHSEYQIINLDAFNTLTNRYDEGRVNVPLLLIGGGYSSRISNNASIFIIALFDIIEDINSPYTNPIIRMGIGIGL